MHNTMHENKAGQHRTSHGSLSDFRLTKRKRHNRLSGTRTLPNGINIQIKRIPIRTTWNKNIQRIDFAPI